MKKKLSVLTNTRYNVRIFRFILTLLLTIFQITCVYSQDTNGVALGQLLNMSLEELMNIRVTTGSLTEIDRSKIPVSLTVISKKDIEVTPARNLLDLIEVYVPSAIFVNHWLGPRLGIRGVSGDQNSSFMVTVNGVKMNSRYQGQPLTEITSKDLSDIERIEIIRGAGSVTYGAGAIGGVINIVTKHASLDKEVTIGVNTDFSYRFGTGIISFIRNSGKISEFFHCSYTNSNGQNDPKFFYVDRAHRYGYGFMSLNWGNKGLGTPAPNFYENYWNKPDIKLMFDIQFLDNYRIWTRFTTYNHTKQQQKTATSDGPDFPGTYGKQLTTVLEYDYKFNKTYKLESSTGISSHSQRDVMFYQGINKPSDDITQRNASFSENDIFIKSQLNLDYSDRY